MPAFLKQPSSNTRSKFYVIWQINLETFEKLFSIALKYLQSFHETITLKYS